MIVSNLKDIAVFLLWNIAVGVALLYLPPLLGLVIAALLFWLLVDLYLLKRHRPRPVRRWSALRLRPLGPTLPWLAASLPAFLGLVWGLNELYLLLVPVPADTLEVYAPLTRTSLSRLNLVLLAVAVAPVVEEFVFRGLIQRRLERRYGPVAGITVAAALFAVVHFLPWVLPVHFLLGIIFGVVVWATRSIWAGVLLHAANNVAAIFGVIRMDGPTPQPTIWETGITAGLWSSVVLSIVAGLAFLWFCRKLVQVGRR